MIPKIIHLCWLSNDDYPPKIKKCIKSWKKNLPDYEIMLWDTKRFNLDKCIWVRQAFDKKNMLLQQIISLIQLWRDLPRFRC